jgi:hypothetical protein
MRRTRLFLILALAALPILGCTKGDECDTCSADGDCKDGFFCVTFSDESRRCGSGVGASTCRVR